MGHPVELNDEPFQNHFLRNDLLCNVYILINIQHNSSKPITTMFPLLIEILSYVVMFLEIYLEFTLN